MTPACIGEPVSWLRLERLALGALAPAEATTVRAHLDACGACRDCLASISDASAIELPALPARVAMPARPRRTWLWRGAFGLALAAAALVLILRPQHPDEVSVDLPGNTAQVKGAGTVVLTAVRERAGDIVTDPHTFAPGDRFKLEVTCAPGAAIWADAVVLQAEQAGAAPAPSHPLPATPVACGNHVVLPGAFRITGTQPARICVALATGAAPARDAVAQPLACVDVTPE